MSVTVRHRPAAAIAMLALALASCQRRERTQPQVSEPTTPEAAAPAVVENDLTAALATATRGVIADLDGDGTTEVVLVDAAQLRVLGRDGRERASAPIPGGIQVLAAGDLDGDGAAEVYAGFGISREHRGARARIDAIRLADGGLAFETVLAPETSRHDVAAVIPLPAERTLLVAYFESTYMVRHALARRGAAGWEIDDRGALRMATSYARGDVDGDGAIDTVVGRLYGDAQGVDGDAFVLRPDGTRTPIPTTRGVRSLAVVEREGARGAEIFLGDGWHQSYRAEGRGLLTHARVADGVRTELVEATAGQYTLERIVPARVHGESVLVTLGNKYVRVFARTPSGWQGHTIAGEARDVAVGELDGVAGDEVLVLGAQPAQVPLRDVIPAP